MITIVEVIKMSGKMHKYNEKKIKQPGKVYETGEPIPGTGIKTKKKEQKH